MDVKSYLHYASEGQNSELGMDFNFKKTIETISFSKTTNALPFTVFKATSLGSITLFKKKGIQLIKSNLIKNSYFDLKLALKKLYKIGIRNILVEGGDDLSSSFLKNKLFNEFYLFKSQKNLSKLVAYKDFNCFKYLSQNYKNKKKINTSLGKDSITLYKR